MSVAAPPKYELECPNCGVAFALEDHTTPRAASCPVCGSVLAIAVMRPTAPPASPPPPLPPPRSAPSYFPPVPVPPIPTEPTRLHPADRALCLVPPWQAVHSALTNARAVVGIAKGIVFLFLGVSYVAAVLGSRRPVQVEDVWATGACAGILILIPALIHVAAQIACSRVARIYGSGRVKGSLIVLLFSLSAIGGAVEPPALAVALVTAGVAAAVISFSMWLAFLAHLADALGDRALRAGMQTFIPKYWIGIVVVVMLLVLPNLSRDRDHGAQVWCCWAGAGALLALLLHWYGLVLGRAVRAVAKRAPAELGS